MMGFGRGMGKTTSKGMGMGKGMGKLKLSKHFGRTGSRSDKGTHRKLGGKGVFKSFGFGKV